MAHDEGLAERIRRVLEGPLEFREQTMFGGLAFMSGGHMFCLHGHVVMSVRQAPS
jgi:hypothetical protein